MVGVEVNGGDYRFNFNAIIIKKKKDQFIALDRIKYNNVTF